MPVVADADIDVEGFTRVGKVVSVAFAGFFHGISHIFQNGCIYIEIEIRDPFFTAVGVYIDVDFVLVRDIAGNDHFEGVGDGFGLAHLKVAEFHRQVGECNVCVAGGKSNRDVLCGLVAHVGKREAEQQRFAVVGFPVGVSVFVVDLKAAEHHIGLIADHGDGFLVNQLVVSGDGDFDGFVDAERIEKFQVEVARFICNAASDQFAVLHQADSGKGCAGGKADCAAADFHGYGMGGGKFRRCRRPDIHGGIAEYGDLVGTPADDHVIEDVGGIVFA